ncbi:MAG: peptidoglycan DD-metalloendopeptidase family protein, partial [Actinomycetota bacterium]|nr:peptidoglycan DD-metalloendopeptidase family protein [Actinomycetota bacterium]
VRAQTLDTPEEEARLLEEVEASLSRKRALDDKVAELDRQLRATQSELRNAENRLYALVVRQRGTERELAVVRDRMALAQRQLQEQAVAAYTGRSEAGRWDDLLRAGSLDQLVTKQSYIRIVAATQAEVIASRERLRDQTNDLLEELRVARDQAEEERDIVQSQRVRLQKERDTEAALRYQVSVEIADYQSLLQQILSRQDEFQAQARELEAQSAAIAESLGRRQSQSQSQSSSSASASSSSGGNGLAGPLNSIRVVSRFGYRVHPIYGSVRLHTGHDLAANSGEPIRAAGDGTVVSAGWMGGYGNATVIDHGGGLATLYAHQSAVLAGTGEQVAKGQVIGRVGCTGSCTGPHLHYEVRIKGTPVDPAPYL